MAVLRYIHHFISLDAHGNTPLMGAISSRAYPAALVLLEAAKRCGILFLPIFAIKNSCHNLVIPTTCRVAGESSNDKETQQKTLMSMVFPQGSPADRSPLHVLCCNDTCSFTWTGAEHINQVRIRRFRS